MNFKSIVLTTSLLSLTTLASASPTTNVFDVAGYFTDNSTLTGSFSVTGGQIGSVDLTVTQPFNGGSEVFNQVGNNDQSDNRGNGVNYWSIDLTDNGDTLVLDLVLPVQANDLTGYNGGALCGTTNNVSNCTARGASSYSVKVDPTLVSGQATYAPEPGSIGLLGAGLSAMGLLLRRRFVKN